MTTSIRTLRPGDVPAVVEFSVRAWQPVFESFARVMGPEIYQRIYPDWQTIQAEAVGEACRAERIAELGIPLAEIGTGGDPGHAPARHVYEKAGFTAVPQVLYYKALA